MMDHPLARRFAGGAGLLAVACLIASTIVQGTPPMADDSIVKVGRYYLDHRDSVLVGNYIGGIAIIALLVFSSALRNYLRTTEGELPAPSSLVLIGGAATAAVATAGGAFALVLAYRLPASAAVAQAFFDANLLVFTFISFPIAVLVGGASAAVARSGGLPRWVAVVGFLVVVLQLVSAASFAKSGAFMPGGTMGFIAFAGFGIWLLIVCVTLLMHKPAEAVRT